MECELDTIEISEVSVGIEFLCCVGHIVTLVLAHRQLSDTQMRCVNWTQVLHGLDSTLYFTTTYSYLIRQ